MCQAKPALRCRADAAKNMQQAAERLNSLLAVPPAQQNDRAIETAMFKLKKHEKAYDLTAIALHSDYQMRLLGAYEDIGKGRTLSAKDEAEYEAIKPFVERYNQLKSHQQDRFAEYTAEATAKHNLSKWFKSATVPSRAQDVIDMFEHLTSAQRGGTEDEGGRDLTEHEQDLYDEAMSQVKVGKVFMLEAEVKRAASEFEAAKQDAEIGKFKPPTPLAPRPLLATEEERASNQAARTEALKRLQASKAAALRTPDAITQHSLPESVQPAANPQSAKSRSSARFTSDAINEHAIPVSARGVGTAKSAASRPSVLRTPDAIGEHVLPDSVKFNSADRRRVAAQVPRVPAPDLAPQFIVPPKRLNFRDWLGKTVLGRTPEPPKQL